MKWYYKLLIGAIIFAVVYLCYEYTTTEGFQTKLQTISNVQYPFKEIFLVAQNDVSEKGRPVPLYLSSSLQTSFSQYYTKQGYTYAEAQKICKDYGGDLATLDQLKLAYDNSGNWCPAGWIKDNTTNAYYLPSDRYPCGTALTGLSKLPATFNKPINKNNIPSIEAPFDSNKARRAFAICYAPKPAEPSVSVNEFNDSTYSMIPDIIINNIMNGNGTDIFPIEFTGAQAYYALSTHGIKTATNTFDSTEARKWLIENYDRVDADILSTDSAYIDNPSKWSNIADITAESCGLIRTQDDIVSRKVLEIQTALRDVSGYVMSATKSKTENAKMQAMMYAICKDTTPDKSPACAKLAILDFELFYMNPTHSTLADLETLNIQIYQRKNEVCQILHNVRTIKETIGCQYTNLIERCSMGCNINSAQSIFDCSNSPILDTNSVGELRYALEQISPLFDVPAYTKFLEAVMNSLSYIVETPSLASFDASDVNMKMVSNAISDVKTLIDNQVASAKNDFTRLKDVLGEYETEQSLYKTSTELF